MDWKLVTFVVLSLYISFPRCIAAQDAGLVKRPDVVNIGALVAYDSTIGKVAKKAIELAVEDVNRNSSVLNGSQLVLTMMNTNCSAFFGTAAGNSILGILEEIDGGYSLPSIERLLSTVLLYKATSKGLGSSFVFASPLPEGSSGYGFDTFRSKVSRYRDLFLPIPFEELGSFVAEDGRVTPLFVYNDELPRFSDSFGGCLRLSLGCVSHS